MEFRDFSRTLTKFVQETRNTQMHWYIHNGENPASLPSYTRSIVFLRGKKLVSHTQKSSFKWVTVGIFSIVEKTASVHKVIKSRKLCSIFDIVPSWYEREKNAYSVILACTLSLSNNKYYLGSIGCHSTVKCSRSNFFISYIAF